MENIVIFGIGSFSKLVKHYFELESKYSIKGFVVDKGYLNKEIFEGLPVYDYESCEKIFPPDNHKMFLAIGYRNMRERESLYKKIKGKGYRMPNFISCRAIVDTTCEINGENNFIFPGVNIEPFTKLGYNNILWSNTLVCHDTVIGNNNFFAAGTTVGGYTQVGNCIFVGFGTTIVNNIRISDESLIGAQSLVLKDTRPYSKNLGIPAKEIGRHEENGIILE